MCSLCVHHYPHFSVSGGRGLELIPMDGCVCPTILNQVVSLKGAAILLFLLCFCFHFDTEIYFGIIVVWEFNFCKTAVNDSMSAGLLVCSVFPFPNWRHTFNSFNHCFFFFFRYMAQRTCLQPLPLGISK